jgi:hypothetical protein
MNKSKLLKVALFLTAFYSSAFAQDAGNFSESALPDKSPNQEDSSSKTNDVDLPAVAVGDAPIKPLEINKSSIIGEIKDSIGSMLINNKVSSLMFDEEQNSNIDRAVDAFKNNQQFSIGEDEKNKNAAKNKENEEKEIKNEKSFIYLASIIYFTSKDWAVWINDQKITNLTNNQDKEIYISSVKADLVKITWKLSLSKWRILAGQKADATPPNLNSSNQVELQFELKPNQTFALNDNKISEGRNLISLLKNKSDSAAKTSQAK